MESFDLRVRDFNLGLTLGSGQVFHWVTSDGCHWHGMLGKDFYHLHQPKASFLRVHTTASPSLGRQDLSHYFGLDQSLQRILKSFPQDPLMREATHAYKGLRLLRQDPWVTLASFILSSTKQILQIRQTVQESVVDLVLLTPCRRIIQQPALSLILRSWFKRVNPAYAPAAWDTAPNTCTRRLA